MTTYYAIGGGLGHARRAQRVLEALAIRDAEIITTDDVPRDLERNREAHRAWLLERFHDHVIIDTFPAGIQGELAGIENITFDYVARLLRWDEYRSAVPFQAPRFRTTHIVEELTKEHAAFVQANSDQVQPLPLRPTGHDPQCHPERVAGGCEGSPADRACLVLP
ncbi:MAG TPA: hypothetical protein VMU84_00080, partial [Thermoanaerobaculia bacterium]|nr:hypothetical protein [Thermoanaerobaculia bacterium]